MCVLDAMLDDVLEDEAAILRYLNGLDSPSWRSSRGRAFDAGEVRDALRDLMREGFVTPCAKSPEGAGDVQPIEAHRLGADVAWGDAWFRLEPTGREAVLAWHPEAERRWPCDDGHHGGP